MRKIVIDIADDGRVDIKFIGGHLNKREMIRVGKAIRFEYRASVRAYRQRSIVDRQKREAEQREVEKKQRDAEAEAENKDLGVNNGQDKITERTVVSETAR